MKRKRTKLQKTKEQKAEVKKAEVQEAEVQKAEMQEAEEQKAEVQKAEVQEAEEQEAEEQKAKVQKAEVQKAAKKGSEIQKSEIQRSKIQRSEIQRSKIQRSEIQRPETQRSEIQKAEMLKMKVQKTEEQKADGRTEMGKITYKDVKNSEEVNEYIRQGNETLGVLGYTDHSSAHALIVATRSGMILQKLGYGKRDIELAKIAGYMHDIGNCVNRKDHAHHGAILSRCILKDMGMKFPEIAMIINTIGSHDETTGYAVNPISAALILADKTDVRRNRVRHKAKAAFDKHDRVNYAVTSSTLEILTEKNTILFAIQLDENICSMMDYFEIFLQRMLMCKRAAEVLDMQFKMTANGNKIC